MKRIIVVLLAAGTVAGFGFYVSRPRASAELPIQPVPEATPAVMADQVQAAQPAAEPAEPAEAPAQKAEMPIAPKTATSAPAAPASAALDASFVTHAVDLLLSPQATFEQKRKAWKQLRDAGKLDLAIADLEQRSVQDPRNADNLAVLGHAYLQKCGTIQDLREQGILAMQADKVFDNALTLDSSNWEARFMKAVAMSYWPPALNKGDEVIQNFQTLIQQQEVQPQQAHFAETYSWLGDQYVKAGRMADAAAVWQRGATLFPADEKLQTKLGSVSGTAK